MRKRTLLSSAALAPVVILAACGGGGGGRTQTSAPPVPAKVEPAPGVLPKPAEPPTKLAKAAYDARMRSLGGRLDAALHRLYPLSYRPGGTAGARDTAASLESARRVVLGIEIALEEIVPPAPVAADHRRLESSLQNLDSEIGELLTSLRTSDVTTFTRWSSLPGLQNIQKATRAMEDKGYDVIRPPG